MYIIKLQNNRTWFNKWCSVYYNTHEQLTTAKDNDIVIDNFDN